MRNLLLQILAGIAGIWLATQFVAGVQVLGDWKTFVIIGAVLGIVNFFLKPLLKLVTFPLQILTLGLFSLLLNVVLVWLVDIIFPELVIPGLFPLLWTTLIIWLLNFALEQWIFGK